MRRTRPDLKKNRKVKTEVFSVDYFYKLFTREKRRYPPSFFCTDKKTKLIRPKSVDKKLFKKIILEYFKMYFFEVYMKQSAIYFPLGGFMKKVKYSKWNAWMPKGKAGKKLNQSDGAIGLFWYQRASKKMAYMVMLKKLTGSSNRIPKIEEIYKTNFNKDLLPIFEQEIKKQYAQKNLYLCSLT